MDEELKNNILEGLALALPKIAIKQIAKDCGGTDRDIDLIKRQYTAEIAERRTKKISSEEAKALLSSDAILIKKLRLIENLEERLFSLCGVDDIYFVKAFPSIYKIWKELIDELGEKGDAPLKLIKLKSVS
jgi:hypothetical protein